MNGKELSTLLIRYTVLIVLGLFNLVAFYYIFTPLTIYPAFFFISKIFEDAVLVSVSPTPAVLFNGYIARIIPACIAGSAYYLLLILNLTTPMNAGKRAGSIFFLFASFLVLNIARITLFAALVPVGFEYFDATHEFTWYFGSTIMVVVIWFANVLIFKIREIPVYSDLKSFYIDIRGKKDGN
ncbi:hypothetical protein CO038_04270 [Candidatus Pacearchaeota archaeon CG_4_9_14_0_2_um_filter_39_13]|nr:pacearchaeosortase [Candidatus Pacearchaeota archaeon]OIO44108.1 MAG: hypothetical protein AUJ64_00620 [Candidatus Pacearchaeota archaeon CG1_02_39_14]PJC44398.1 MAG: hypothetical protein CO038_04270 [Candidatus Pacearchaeota archaeon CG_4_9_14_0_2_um_filter_39_13]